MSDDERCRSMREGGDMQCVYLAGHSGPHQWGSVALSAWAFTDEEDIADHAAIAKAEGK